MADDDQDAVPTLPQENDAGDAVSDILKNVKAAEEPTSSFAGAGRTLGSSSSSSAAATDDAAAADSEEGAPTQMPDRSNARKIRVIFWADGFTVEDITAEEEAAAAATRAPAAPRRTGLATLSSERARTDQPTPKLPDLRKYEENEQFMADLKRSIPPAEFRELDLSSGVPRPRPVDIMLGDMRPRAYPHELVARQNAMKGVAASAKATSLASHTPFSGEGRTLGGGDDAAASSAEPSAPVGGESGWAYATREAPTIDESAPLTDVQVRMPGTVKRFRLNRTHTVADLKALVESTLAASGEAPRKYVLSSGFPPKPLTDDEATMDAAGLLNAAVTHRWS